MRELATIRKVGEIYPIPERDRIELAMIDGWSVIVKKDEFKAGDLCVYIEIDSVLPPIPEFEFLSSKKYRIKTMKMAGVISQGICFPLSILPKSNYKEGDNVTETLGVKQYEPTMDIEVTERQPKKHTWLHSKLMRFRLYREIYRRVSNVTEKKCGFPSFVSRTDEPRIQNMPHILKNKRIKYIATEKLDGCVTGETLISTDKGQVKISKLVTNKIKANVLTYNEELKICEYKPIVDWHRIPANRPRYKIGVGFRGKGNRGKFIECTDNHKFLTDTGWKRADELVLTDKLMHLNNNYPNELNEVLFGCLLGDSSLNSNSETGFYRTVNFNHSIKQKDYFEYKKKLFGKYFIQNNSYTSGYGSEILRGKLISNLGLLKIANEICSVNGKKKVTKKWVDSLTPISLAFWFMDDGTLLNRENPDLRCRANISTQGFSLNEIKLLQEGMKEKFNIEVSIGDNTTYKGYCIIIDADNTEKFCSLIAPYICDSMKYKLPKHYESLSCYFKDFSFDGNEGVIETPILSIEKITKNNISYVFDLEVKDNHNYFAKNILVHNCSSTYVLQKRSFLWFKSYEYMVCSRNRRIYTPSQDNSSYWDLSEKYDISNKLMKLLKGKYNWVAIQGECISAKVQGNKYKVVEPDLYVFNVIFPTGRLGTLEAKEVCDKLGLKFVPILDENYTLPDTVEKMLEYSNGKSKIADTIREGVVIRSKDGKQSFKAVNPYFLMKYDE